jgi:hypothetical protein
VVGLHKAFVREDEGFHAGAIAKRENIYVVTGEQTKGANRLSSLGEGREASCGLRSAKEERAQRVSIVLY